ncbi:MAG: PrsW family intramembrane metalloprotease [Actinobacteria bacterium]|nr:PrsW family intramembrane metalloprotease [Actinomycetota bacterium]
MALAPSTLVVMAGVMWWVGIMLAQTGGSGWRALWAAVSFVVGLMLVTSATRTVGLRRLVSFFIVGGFLLTIGWIVIRLLSAIVGPDVTGVYLVPLVEETLKIAPVLAFLWSRRRRRILTLGALDIMVLAAAVGAGTGMVEEAFIRLEFAWPDVVLLPAVATTSLGRLIAGHAIWSALAGLTLGLGVLLRSRRGLAYLIAPSGFLLAVLDHSLTNAYSGGDPGLGWRVLNGVFLNGYLTSVVLYLGLAATIVFEAWIVYRKLPRLPDLRLPLKAIRDRESSPLNQWRAAWTFLTTRRRLAFANFHFRSSHTEPERLEAARTAMGLGAALAGQRT